VAPLLPDPPQPPSPGHVCGTAGSAPWSHVAEYGFRHAKPPILLLHGQRGMIAREAFFNPETMQRLMAKASASTF